VSQSRVPAGTPSAIVLMKKLRLIRRDHQRRGMAGQDATSTTPTTPKDVTFDPKVTCTTTVYGAAVAGVRSTAAVTTLGDHRRVCARSPASPRSGQATVRPATSGCWSTKDPLRWAP
jgi:hypothetical protein